MIQTLSYGLYIWHIPVITTFMGFGITGNWWHLLAVATVSLLMAFASWRLVEKPALSLKKRWQVVLQSA